MNSSKRKRHCLYFWIDVFFLLLPLFIFVSIFLYDLISYTLIFQQQAAAFGSSEDIWNDFNSFQWYAPFYDTVNDDSGFIQYLVYHLWNNLFTFEGSDTFSWYVISFLNRIFSFFGFGNIDNFGNDNLGSFIFYYIVYVIDYEFVSFFIQIVLWIPRFFKNKLYDRGLME